MHGKSVRKLGDWLTWNSFASDFPPFWASCSWTALCWLFLSFSSPLWIVERRVIKHIKNGIWGDLTMGCTLLYLTARLRVPFDISLLLNINSCGSTVVKKFSWKKKKKKKKKKITQIDVSNKATGNPCLSTLCGVSPRVHSNSTRDGWGVLTIQYERWTLWKLLHLKGFNNIWSGCLS